MAGMWMGGRQVVQMSLWHKSCKGAVLPESSSWCCTLSSVYWRWFMRCSQVLYTFKRVLEVVHAV